MAEWKNSSKVFIIFNLAKAHTTPTQRTRSNLAKKRMLRSNNAMDLINAINDIIKLMNDDKKKISRRAIERLV
jgi:hypothetical protein